MRHVRRIHPLENSEYLKLVLYISHYDYRTTLYRLYSQTVVRCYMRCSSKYWSLSFIVYTLVSVHGGW